MAADGGWCVCACVCMCVVCEREDEAKTDKHELESGLKGHHVAEDVCRNEAD